jgi:hypothetical protein
MKLGSSSFLGLAIGDREIACVQIAGASGKRRRARAARFDVPADLSLDKPEALGAALKAFLAEHRMGASQTVVGVPARWLIAEPRELPPTDRVQALASLRLQAERISLGDDARLVFDAAGTYGNARAGHALLVGLSQDRLDRLKQLCAAAGLTPVGVTATALVVSENIRNEGEGDGAVIVFSGEGAELVLRSDMGPRAFRHLSGVRGGRGVLTSAGGSGTPLQSLTAELWRALAMGRMGGTAGTAPSRVLLLGDSGFSSQECQEMAGELGRQVQCADAQVALSHMPGAASLNGQAEQVAAERLWPAVALAGAGARVESLPVNFLRPKLAPPKEARISRTLVLAIAAAVAVVMGIMVLWWQASQTEALAAEVEAILDERAPDIAAAEEYISKVTYARGFFRTRPPALDALRDLSQSFGREDRIWTTSFSIQESGKGQIQGRAADQRTVLTLNDRLVADGRFQGVKLEDMREATGGGGDRGGRSEIVFTLSFTYLPQAAAEKETP